LTSRIGDLKALREQQAALEEEVDRLNTTFRATILELRDHASQCLRDYRHETGRSDLPATAPALAVAPEKVDECRSYLETIEADVTAAVDRLVEFRRVQLRETVDDVRMLLKRLEASGETLPAVSQYLDEETYLDLSLGDARARLRAERALVERRLRESEERRREQERQHRLGQARLALEQLRVSLETSGDASATDFNQAAILQTEGDAADLRALWRTLGLFLSKPLTTQYPRVLRDATALVGRCLNPDVEEPPFELIEEWDTQAVVSLDAAIIADAEGLDRLAAVCTGADVGDDFVISRLCRLKSRLPCVSFEVLRVISDARPFAPEDLATWFLEPPDNWSQLPAALHWLARKLEDQDLWREAYACRLFVEPEAHSERLLALAIVAATSDLNLAPASEDAWWDFISHASPLFSSEHLAPVVAIATMLLAYRAGFESNDVLRMCSTSLHAHRGIRVLVDFAAEVWPAGVADSLREVDDLLNARSDLIHRIEVFLDTVRTPTGMPSREFYREVILPYLRDVFRHRGAAGLADVDVGIVNELLLDGYRGLNPLAIQATQRLMTEVVKLASELLEVETALRVSSGSGSAELLKLLSENEAELLSRDPLVRWAFGSARTLVTAQNIVSPVNLPTTFSYESLTRVLFLGNPLVDTAPPGAVGPDRLFIAALEGLRHRADFELWRIKYVTDCQAFGLASRYAAMLPTGQREEVERSIAEAFAERRRHVEAEIQLVSAFLDGLEPTEEVEIARLFLDDATAHLNLQEPVEAKRLVEQAMIEYERIDGAQAEARAQLIEQVRNVVAVAVGRLLQRPAQRVELAGLLTGAINAVGTDRADVLAGYVRAIEAALTGKPFDPALIRSSVGQLPAGALSDPGNQSASREDVGLVGVASEIVIPNERTAIRLEQLPRIVRSELEYMIASPPNIDDAVPLWANLRPGAPGPLRESAAAALFCQEWPKRERWEEPLIALLEERARRTFDEANYLRAAEYFLGATHVAYHATGRVTRALEAARSTSFSYAVSRFMRLQATAGARSAMSLTMSGSSLREWVRLFRSYLLLHAEPDLADVLTTLLNAAPDMASEFLEIPMSELPTARLGLIGALLGNPESVSASGDLLISLTTHGLPASSRHAVEEFVTRFAHVAGTVGIRATTVGQREQNILDDLEQECQRLPLDAETSALFQDAIYRLQLGARVPWRPGSAEAHITSVTKEIFLDAFVRSDVVPVHLRIKLSPDSTVIRDAVISLRTDHPELDIAPSHASIEVPWLRGGEPLELTCMVLRRAGVDDARSLTVRTPSDLTLEVSDVGVRQEGTLLAGAIQYRGKKHSLRVQTTYPYSAHANPYVVGKPIQEPGLIKGRDEETQTILGTLRGRYQDNVPLVWGPRRIGKTTLLYKLKTSPEVRAHYEPILCDMEGRVHETDTTRDFVKRLAEYIGTQLKGTALGRLPVPRFEAPSDPLDIFQNFLNRLAEASGRKRLLLMFDEMELFFDVLRSHQRARPDAPPEQCLHQNIVHMLRHNMQHSNRISFILSGTKRLVDMAAEAGERLFHLPVPVPVGELREADAIALIDDPLEGIFEYSAAAKQRLVQLTGRNPYLLQNVCLEMFSYMKLHRLSVCSEIEVDAVIREQVIIQSGYFDFQISRLRSTPAWLAVAAAVAELTQEDRRSDVNAIRARLELREDPTAYDQKLEGIARALVEDSILIERRNEYRFRYPIVGMHLASETGF
jgi:hypothetical protein